MGLMALLLGLSGPQSNRYGRNVYSFISHNASSNSIGLLGSNGISQCLQARMPDFYYFWGDTGYRMREYVSGIVHPSGTPIIHSIKDGLAVCLYRGILSRSFKSYAKPIRYIMRLVELAHDSLERRK